jgi:hypothetical protein
MAVMAVMMPIVPMMVAPRPEVEVNARAVVVVVPVAWAVPMATMPVAPVAHLLDLRAIARCGLEVSCKPAGRRGLARCREQSESKGSDRPSKPTGVFHFVDLLSSGGACILVRSAPAQARGRRLRRAELPSVVNG